MDIARSTAERLSLLYHFLGMLAAEGKQFVTSFELSSSVGVPAHTIRKDLSLIGMTGMGGKLGYGVEPLRKRLGGYLGIGTGEPAGVAIVGLGRLGSAILAFPDYRFHGFVISAGFDRSVNRIELISTAVPLFHVSRLEELVGNLGIELAILAVPAAEAGRMCSRLVRAGIRGIVNCTPAAINPDSPGVFVRNISVIGELSILSVLIADQKTSGKRRNHVPDPDIE